MINLVLGKIEDSNLFRILSAGEDQLTVESRLKSNPKKTNIILHNKKRRLSEIEKMISSNYAQGIYTAHVFYKDGKVRFPKSRAKLRRRLCLNKYTPQQINQLLYLEDEKPIIASTGLGSLVYYQISTKGPQLRLTNIERAVISPTQVNRISTYQNELIIGYWMPKDLGEIGPAARLMYHDDLRFAQLVSAEKI